MRKFGRLDGCQAAIVKALRKAGCSVQSLASIGGGCPDVVCGYDGRSVLLELKDGSKPPSARKLTEAEAKFHAEWRGEVYVVESVEEALSVVLRREKTA